MSLRFAHAGDFYLDEDRYLADTAQCLEWFVADGQFVLVNEAVNLGIAIYNMRQGEGTRYETLFRDETVGALDAANGKEYVRMLRRAMDLGGFPLHYLIKSDSRSGSSTPFWSLPLSKPSAESACTVTLTLPARSARFAMAFHAENN